LTNLWHFGYSSMYALVYDKDSSDLGLH
jgi:hypothetical protein